MNDLDDFVAAAVAFCDEHAEPKPADTPFVWGEGSDRVGIFDERSRDDEREVIVAARAFRQARFDAGFGWITGSPTYGGAGLSKEHQAAYDRVEANYRVPSQAPYLIGLGMVAPTILAHGTDAAKQRYLRSLWRGDVIACQLFSEPGAGSDLASLQMRAERDGDEWIVNGQKVWTSGAHYADIGEVIARTDPSLPKHRGLTGFLVDMHAAGVDVRPLRQMTGGTSFNEVFFTDVRVPDDHRLGDVNGGWTVALTTLMNERAAIGAGSDVGGGAGMIRRLSELVRVFGLADDPVIRQQLADIAIRIRVNRTTNRRALAKLAVGQLPGPELSIAKLASTDVLSRIGELVSTVIGPRLTADTGEWGTYAWNQLILGTPGLRIAGGTDEVLRNIVAERVLGLPKDPAIDNSIPFTNLRVD